MRITRALLLALLATGVWGVPRVSGPVGAAQAPPRFAFEVLGHTLPRGVVALTFDDGPHRTYTPAVLDLLDRHKARATFFMLGQNARVLPGVAAEVAARGHAIGAHSYDHRKLTTLTDERLDAQVAGSQKLVEAAVGRPVALFRCPYGARDSRVIRAIDRARMRHILWSIDSRDWQDKDAARTAQRVLVTLFERQKGVLLMHDIHPHSVEALRLILEGLEPLRRAGKVQLVTLDQLLGFAPSGPAVSAR